MANTHCPDCGASYALVGRVHNCRPRIIVAAVSPAPTPEFVAGAREFLAKAQRAVTETYKYRDADARRSYMRDYMRKKRNGGQVRISTDQAS